MSRQGLVEEVEWLLSTYKNSIDANIKDDQGNTALILAAQNNHVDVMKLLLNIHQIDVHAANDDNMTTLVALIIQGCTDGIKLLLRNDEDTDMECKTSEFKQSQIESAFITAAGYEIVSEDGIKYLLEHHNIDINAVDENGFCALCHAVYGNRTESVKLLLSYKDEIDLKLQSCTIRNPIVAAVGFGKIDILAMLIDTGKIAQVDIEFAFVFYDRDLNAMKYLVDNNFVSINATFQGITALINAVRFGWFEKVEFLLSDEYANDIDVNAASDSGVSALNVLETNRK